MQGHILKRHGRRLGFHVEYIAEYFYRDRRTVHIAYLIRSRHNCLTFFIWTESAAIGRRHGKLGRFTEHDPVATDHSALGSDQR